MYTKIGRLRQFNRSREIEFNFLTAWTTVLSGAEERGVDGPSLDRSYFSRLQPISFLFFHPSSSHIAKLVARARYSISMLHTHATHAGPGKRLKCFDPSTWSRFEVSNAADHEEVVFTANVVSRVVKRLLTQFSSLDSFLFLDKNSSLAVLRQTVLRHPTVLYFLEHICSACSWLQNFASDFLIFAQGLGYGLSKSKKRGKIITLHFVRS